jgi:hypothetical protein
MDIMPLMAIPLLYYHQQNEHGSDKNLHIVPEMMSCNIYLKALPILLNKFLFMPLNSIVPLQHQVF